MINAENCESCEHMALKRCGGKCLGYKPGTKEQFIKRWGVCGRSNCDKKQCAICIQV